MRRELRVEGLGIRGRAARTSRAESHTPLSENGSALPKPCTRRYAPVLLCICKVVPESVLTFLSRFLVRIMSRHTFSISATAVFPRKSRGFSLAGAALHLTKCYQCPMFKTPCSSLRQWQRGQSHVCDHADHEYMVPDGARKNRDSPPLPQGSLLAAPGSEPTARGKSCLFPRRSRAPSSGSAALQGHTQVTTHFENRAKACQIVPNTPFSAGNRRRPGDELVANRSRSGENSVELARNASKMGKVVTLR